MFLTLCRFVGLDFNPSEPIVDNPDAASIICRLFWWLNESAALEIPKSDPDLREIPNRGYI